MLKISVMSWMVLTVILISLPIGLISFFFSKKIFKKLSRLLGKIDTFDAFLAFKKEMAHLYRTKFSTLRSRVSKEKIEGMKHDEQEFLNTIDEIIKPQSSVSKYLEPEVSIDEEEDRTTMIKKRKLLEKITYDALVFRKDGKLDEYEKKIIE